MPREETSRKTKFLPKWLPHRTANQNSKPAPAPISEEKESDVPKAQRLVYKPRHAERDALLSMPAQNRYDAQETQITRNSHSSSGTTIPDSLCSAKATVPKRSRPQLTESALSSLSVHPNQTIALSKLALLPHGKTKPTPIRFHCDAPGSICGTEDTEAVDWPAWLSTNYEPSTTSSMNKSGQGTQNSSSAEHDPAKWRQRAQIGLQSNTQAESKDIDVSRTNLEQHRASQSDSIALSDNPNPVPLTLPASITTPDTKHRYSNPFITPPDEKAHARQSPFVSASSTTASTTSSDWQSSSSISLRERNQYFETYIPHRAQTPKRSIPQYFSHENLPNLRAKAQRQKHVAESSTDSIRYDEKSIAPSI
jgi:hypothetical protein